MHLLRRLLVQELLRVQGRVLLRVPGLQPVPVLALLLVQVLGLPFCLLYMKLAEKFGARTMVGVGICVYMFICVFAFFMNSLWQFWVLAVLCATS